MKSPTRTSVEPPVFPREGGTTARPVVYPESDGKPISDNTLQFRWIQTLYGGIRALFRDDPDVFVAGDLFWYPVEGNNKIRSAPDAMVVFGRPPGERGSYIQWEEGGVAPQVVFEVLSLGNRPGEMQKKFLWYQTYGVLEYYIYNPYKITLQGWRRDDPAERFARIRAMQDDVSPRLGILFDLSGRELAIYAPNGVRFRTPEQMARDEQLLQAQRDTAWRERDTAAARVERLAAQLRALGINPDE